MALRKIEKNKIGLEYKTIFNGNVDELILRFQELSRENEVLHSRIGNIVLKSGGESLNEVVDARVDSDGVAHATLYDRLLATDNKSLERFQELQEQIAANQAEIAEISALIQTFIGTVNDVIDLYVSAEIGSEDGDGSEERPFKRVQQAIDAIPILSASEYVIWLESGTYLEDVQINSRSVRSIIIQSVNHSTNDASSGDTDVFVRSFSVYNTNNYLLIRGITFVDQANSQTSYGSAKAAVAYDLSKYVSVQNCRFAENTRALGSNYAAVIGASSTCALGSKCFFQNQSYCVSARAGAQVLVGNCYGSGNGIAYYANQAVIRGGSNSNVTADTLKTEVYGGQVLGLG